jgi:hypothetical protein
MAWRIVAPNNVGWQPITSTDTTARHPLGTIVQAVDPTYGAGEFIYLDGVASCAEKSWVSYNADAGDCTLLAANAIGPVAVAMAATTASYYGWFQISGKALGKCLTSFADNGRVYATATAGSIDDASVAGDVVFLAKGASTTTADSGYAEFEIHRPFIQDRVSIIS